MVVLDTWALLAYLNGEQRAERVRAAWLNHGAAMSSINLGEVLYVLLREKEESAAATIEIARRHLEVVDPDWPQVAAAAAIKAGGGLSYADAFCIATAARLDAPLLTGDPEIVAQAETHSVRVVDLRD